MSSTLYPALCRPNVKLHPKDDGIAEINERGILTAKGEQIDLDCIVYSTGYDATDGVISYPVIGKGGKSVQDFWAEFPRAYLGTTMPGFPNLFIVTGPNTGIGHTSAIFVIEAQMEYIRRAIAATQKQGAKAIEVKAESEADYTGMIHREMRADGVAIGRLPQLVPEQERPRDRHVPGLFIHLPPDGQGLQAEPPSLQLKLKQAGRHHIRTRRHRS